MGILLAIDYGQKRIGIAHTDSFQKIASGLITLSPDKALLFIKKYVSEKVVDAIIIGQPLQMDGNPSMIESSILKFIKKLKKELPEIMLIRFDERFTSKIAFRTLIDSGAKKNQIKNKKLIDKISATIILQSYLESIN